MCRCRLNHPLKTIEEDTIEIVGFHAHIYFDTDSHDAAARVREGLSRFEVQLGPWHHKPIGPHPEAMYQVAFLPQQCGKVVPWLMLHRSLLYVDQILLAGCGATAETRAVGNSSAIDIN